MAQPSAYNQSLAQLAYLDRQNVVPVLARLAIAVAVAVTLWNLRRRSRAALAVLEPHLLKDIGLTPEDARAEAQRRFWQG